jgi:hypothetical protein
MPQENTVKKMLQIPPLKRRSYRDPNKETQLGRGPGLLNKKGEVTFTARHDDVP